MIVDNEDGGLNIKFSRADLVAMPPSDFQLLQLFVEALTEEYRKEEVNDLPHGETDPRSVRRLMVFWQALVLLIVGGGLVFFGVALGSGLGHNKENKHD